MLQKFDITLPQTGFLAGLRKNVMGHGPDLVVWSPEKKRVIIMELTVPWEENIEKAEERKEERQEKEKWQEEWKKVRRFGSLH